MSRVRIAGYRKRRNITHSFDWFLSFNCLLQQFVVLQFFSCALQESQRFVERHRERYG